MQGPEIGIFLCNQAHYVALSKIAKAYRAIFPVYSCRTQCDQIFGPQKALIFGKKREKKRQPKISTFLLHICTFQGGYTFIL